MTKTVKFGNVNVTLCETRNGTYGCELEHKHRGLHYGTTRIAGKTVTYTFQDKYSAVKFQR